MMGSMDKNLKKKEVPTQLPSVPSTVIVDLGGGWVGGGLCGRAGMPERGEGPPDFRCCEYGSDFVITHF